MRNLVALLLFNAACLSVQTATVEFAFHLGTPRAPRLDALHPDVARYMAFRQDGETLIVREMDGSVVEWNLRTGEKRGHHRMDKKRFFAYASAADRLLVRDATDTLTLRSLKTGDETLLTQGDYESGSLSADGRVAALSKGEDAVEVWQLTHEPGKSQKVRTLRTALPVRNGLTLSADGQFIAAAEGSYREGEGHRTLIEIWRTTDTAPLKVFNTGEILGVWNVLFSPDARLVAVDTQQHDRSGIRVWEVSTGRQRLAKSGFQAYWTRALAYSPNATYLASGDEAGNLRVWDLSEADSVIWETYPTGIQALAFSPDAAYLAVALWDTTIQILHWRNRDE